MQVAISISDEVEVDEVVSLYKANEWSSADKPKELLAALRGSHTLVTARVSTRLVGIGNAISDGHCLFISTICCIQIQCLWYGAFP